MGSQLQLRVVEAWKDCPMLENMGQKRRFDIHTVLARFLQGCSAAPISTVICILAQMRVAQREAYICCETPVYLVFSDPEFKHRLGVDKGLRLWIGMTLSVSLESFLPQFFCGMSHCHTLGLVISTSTSATSSHKPRISSSVARVPNKYLESSSTLNYWHVNLVKVSI